MRKKTNKQKIENYFDFELKNHLFAEFQLHGLSIGLHESRGAVDGLDYVVDAFYKMIRPQIMATLKDRKERQILYTEDDISNLNTFFNKFKLVLITAYGNTDTDNAAQFCPSSVTKKNGQIICEPTLLASLCATNEDEAKYKVMAMIAHELTHAFNQFFYLKKTEAINDDNVSIKNRYKDIISAKQRSETTYRALGHVLYTMSRIERNAYVAELRQELINRQNEFYDAKSLLNTLKNTMTWSRFKSLYRNILILVYEAKDELRPQLLADLNEIMGLNLTTWNQFQKYLLRRFAKYKKSFSLKIVKIAFDVYYQTKIKNI